MSLNLFIIGPSGCGKTTQAKMIAQKYNLSHFSMGQLLRDEIASGSALGLQAKQYVDNGTWAPDDLILDILTSHLQKINNQNFIIDGFPRVLNQGRNVEYYLKTINLPFSLLIHLDVTFDEIKKRRELSGQNFQPTDRTDNTPEAIAQRQKSYDETINPILDYFQSVGKLYRVNGNRPVDPIFNDICIKIDNLSYTNAII
jgi:adenylate kinase